MKQDMVNIWLPQLVKFHLPKSLTAQYFRLGQTSSGANYFYQLNQRGDVAGVTDSTGNVVASIAYDAYGRPTVISGSLVPDFGFTGLYVHQSKT